MLVLIALVTKCRCGAGSPVGQVHAGEGEVGLDGVSPVLGVGGGRGRAVGGLPLHRGEGVLDPLEQGQVLVRQHFYHQLRRHEGCFCKR